jgi:hypothetical protein
MTAAIAGLRAAAEASEHVTDIVVIDGEGAELRLTARLPNDPDRLTRITALLVSVPIPKGERPRKPDEVLHPDDAIQALLDIQRALPHDRGVAYTPTLDPHARRDEPVSGWRVVVSRESPDGTAGIEAEAQTPEAAAEHAPEGTVIPQDEDSARRLQESLRRTERDFVPTTFEGMRLRIDRIPTALRDAADRLERADPARVSAVFGPRGLWQCRMDVSTDRGHIATPIAFSAVDPPDGWDVAVRGTVFDFALTVGINRSDRETYFQWTLVAENSPARERLVALEFLYAYSGRGRMRIASVSPELGDGDFDLEGFALDDGVLFERELYTQLTAIEKHVGMPIEVPGAFDPQWLARVSDVDNILRTGTATMTVERLSVDVPSGVRVPDTGFVSTFDVPIPVTTTIGDVPVDFGVGRGQFHARVASTHPRGEGVTTIVLVPADGISADVTVTSLLQPA